MIPDSLAGIADTAGSLALALLLGAVIGAERQYRERIASLRTNVLVALGAAAFVDLGIQMAGGDGAMRVLANVVTGVGFLGAGLILREGGTIRGLNTAATVWCSAAVGAAAGANLPVQAVAIAVFVLVCNTALRPLGKLIDRLPVRDQAAEARYQVAVTVPEPAVAAAREALGKALSAGGFPVAGWEQHARQDGQVAILATLVSSSARPEELDAIVARLRRVTAATDTAWVRSPLA
ncbi:MAG: MgtC/SapB family protein [Roseomonas sp.]|nr:MgtC/SapB family protein [Roseomonas sp.]MCA3381319.1 MgtC/SapB family protein [Roseomonas sp.]